MVGPSGRNRRLDEDFREEVAKNALALGRASSLGAFLRMAEDGDDSAAGHILEQRLGCYVAICRRYRSAVHWLSVALDGSKVGQPLEDTEVYLTWNGDSERVAVGIPQVGA